MKIKCPVGYEVIFCCCVCAGIWWTRSGSVNGRRTLDMVTKTVVLSETTQPILVQSIIHT